MTRYAMMFSAGAALMLMTACGGGSTSAASVVTAPTGPVDVTGFWTLVPSGHATLTLRQAGGVVTGSSDFTTDSNPAFGVYAGEQGEVTGTVTGNTVTLKTVFTRLTNQAGPIADCVETVTGESTVTIRSSNSSLIGTFSQVDTCGGTVVYTKGGTSNFTRP